MDVYRNKKKDENLGEGVTLIHLAFYELYLQSLIFIWRNTIRTHIHKNNVIRFSKAWQVGKSGCGERIVPINRIITEFGETARQQLRTVCHPVLGDANRLTCLSSGPRTWS